MNLFRSRSSKPHPAMPVMHNAAAMMGVAGRRTATRIVMVRACLSPLVILATLLLAPTCYAQATESTPAEISTPELSASWDAAYKIQNWPETIRLGKNLAKRFPNNPAYSYNLACVYSRKGDLRNGILSLDRAVELGFNNTMVVVSDTDLEKLRSSPETQAQFETLVEQTQANRERANAEFKGLADAAAPLIWTPPGHDPKTAAPIIIALHPYGTTAEWILDYWKATAEEHGAVILAPRAVRAERNGFQWGTVDEAQYIVGTSFDTLKDQVAIDESRILLTGFSQGGYMAFNLGRLHGDLVTSVLPIAGRYERELGDPSLVPEGHRARFYIIVGTEDATYPSNVLAEEDLRTAGFDVKMKTIEGLGHAFPPHHEEELRESLKFLWK